VFSNTADFDHLVSAPFCFCTAPLQTEASWVHTISAKEVCSSHIPWLFSHSGNLAQVFSSRIKDLQMFRWAVSFCPGDSCRRAIHQIFFLPSAWFHRLPWARSLGLGRRCLWPFSTFWFCLSFLSLFARDLKWLLLLRAFSCFRHLGFHSESNIKYWGHHLLHF